jgi:hypothetical protein
MIDCCRHGSERPRCSSTEARSPALLGLALVTGAAAYVPVENSTIQHATDEEPSDAPELSTRI